MTIDDQLRDLARCVDQHQQVITADEIIQRATSRRNGSFATRSGFNDQSTFPGEMTVPFIEEEATMIDLDSDTRATAPRKRPKSLIAAGLLAAAAVVALAFVAMQPDDAEIPADQPSPTVSVPVSVPVLGSIPAGDASIEPGTYLVPSSAWSVTDFTVTFPEGWIVEYGHVYGKGVGDDQFGFHAVVVDDIWAESCAGSNSGPIDVGPDVDDLTAALLQQPGPTKSEPVDTTLGGYPATRIDLTVPDGFDLSACNAADAGLQIWHSEPAVKNFVLIDDHIASVYILDINGERQVFLTQHGPTTTDAHLAELQTVLDSIRIES